MPEFVRNSSDELLKKINQSGHKWVVLADEKNNPLLILDADGALRAALFDTDKPFDIYDFCHRPLIVRDESLMLSEVLWHLKAQETLDAHDDGTIDVDVVLVWGAQPRIITGADILGRLLKGISAVTPASVSKNAVQGSTAVEVEIETKAEQLTTTINEPKA